MPGKKISELVQLPNFDPSNQFVPVEDTSANQTYKADITQLYPFISLDYTNWSTPAATNGYGSIAIGYESQANSDSVISLGTTCITNNSNSISIGNNVLNNGQYTVAIGDLSDVSNPSNTLIRNSVAVGYGAIVQSGSSIAIGSQSFAGMTGSVAIGRFSEAIGLNTTAVGYDSIAEANGAFQLGSGYNGTPNTLQYLNTTIATANGIKSPTNTVDPTGSAPEGSHLYNTTTNQLFISDGSAWNAIGGGGGSPTVATFSSQPANLSDTMIFNGSTNLTLSSLPTNLTRVTIVNNSDNYSALVFSNQPGLPDGISIPNISVDERVFLGRGQQAELVYNGTNWLYLNPPSSYVRKSYTGLPTTNYGSNSTATISLTASQLVEYIYMVEVNKAFIFDGGVLLGGSSGSGRLFGAALIKPNSLNNTSLPDTTIELGNIVGAKSYLADGSGNQYGCIPPGVYYLVFKANSGSSAWSIPASNCLSSLFQPIGFNNTPWCLSVNSPVAGNIVGNRTLTSSNYNASTNIPMPALLYSFSI